MPDLANTTLSVANRVDLTLDVKRYLIARLNKEFKEAAGKIDATKGTTETGYPLIEISSAFPTVESWFPCISVVCNGQQTQQQFIGETMGHDEDDNELRRSSFHESYGLYVFSLKSPERDRIAKDVGFMLGIIARELSAIEGIESFELSGAIDHQAMDSKARVQYMTDWTLSLVNPHVDAPAPRSDEEGQYRVTHVDVEGEFE